MSSLRRNMFVAVVLFGAGLGCVAANGLSTAPSESTGTVGHLPLSVDERAEWANTLERVAKGVVAIQIDQVTAFDTEWGASAQATGFVVDAARGIILTNRHVVTPGPVTAHAIFVNREEVDLQPLYRDPVHDFGFYHYDPKKLRFIQPVEIPLAPEGARVGTEIRVVGNDAGEQLSFLSGTLARLDRDAPNYGFGKYNDFNTFYYQAASSTSGGSSGSPVIDVHGRAVALNAGGATGAASSFYLPLDRVVRALDLLKAGKPVSRGSIGAIFGYTPYDELRRLGLRTETETQRRASFPKHVGMLVVREVQAGSGADNQLAPGDILLQIDGRPVIDFLTLDAVLDDSVRRSVKVDLERGGQPMTRELPVEDLHDLVPAEYIEFGDGVFHALSYQIARHMNVPVKGVFVADPGYVFGGAGVPRGAVIVALDGHAIATLADFENALAHLAQDDRATLRIFTMEDSRTPQIRSVTIDRRWFPSQHCRRNDVSGFWPCEPIGEGPASSLARGGSTNFQVIGESRADATAASLVSISMSLPYPVSGVAGRNYHGTGVVVDAERGLLVTDRNTVPISLGDVRLTFGGTVEIPGHVEYIHPLHNLAFVSYDPRLIAGTPVRAARFVSDDLRAGDDVWVIGLRPDQRLASMQTRVGSIEPVAFAPSMTLEFRDSNVEAVTLINPPNGYDGVVVDHGGGVRGLWGSFSFDNGRQVTAEKLAIPSKIVLAAIDAVRSGGSLRSLEVELHPMPLAFARKLGLSDSWIKRLTARGANRQILAVARAVTGSPAADLLQNGDLLLAMDGAVVANFLDVEQRSQRAVTQLTILRNGIEQDVTVPTVALDGRGLERVVVWAGATLQAPHHDLAAQRSVAPQGVLVAYAAHGSPAMRYGLWAGRRIVEVDGRPTPDLTTFLAAVADRPDRSSLRLKLLTLSNTPEMITLKLDRQYFPAYSVERTDGIWTRRVLD